MNFFPQQYDTRKLFENEISEISTLQKASTWRGGENLSGGATRHAVLRCVEFRKAPLRGRGEHSPANATKTCGFHALPAPEMYTTEYSHQMRAGALRLLSSVRRKIMEIDCDREREKRTAFFSFPAFVRADNPSWQIMPRNYNRRGISCYG